MWTPNRTLPGIVDINNSSSRLLLAGQTYTGRPSTVIGYSQITVFVYSDVNSASDGFKLQISSDGMNWDRTKPLTVIAGATQSHTLAVVAAYFRIIYINGTSNQTSFRLQTLLHNSKNKHLTTGLDETISARADTEVVRVANDPFLDFSRGVVSGIETFRRFGANPNISTSSEDIWTVGGKYPWPTTAETLRIKAGGDANDAAAGTGAREVVVTYLDENWTQQSETLVTAGALASATTSGTAYRCIRAYVSKSGTYGGNNIGNVVIENSTSLQVVAQMGVGFGQTQLSMYTVPAGKTAYMKRIHFTVDSTKTADMSLYQRRDADVIAPPYTASRLVFILAGLQGDHTSVFNSLIEFPAKTDIWCEGKLSSGNGGVEASYDLFLVSDTSGFVP